jgi:hypothetical protein
VVQRLLTKQASELVFSSAALAFGSKSKRVVAKLKRAGFAP